MTNKDEKYFQKLRNSTTILNSEVSLIDFHDVEYASESDTLINRNENSTYVQTTNNNAHMRTFDNKRNKRRS